MNIHADQLMLSCSRCATILMVRKAYQEDHNANQKLVHRKVALCGISKHTWQSYDQKAAPLGERRRKPQSNPGQKGHPLWFEGAYEGTQTLKNRERGPKP